MIRLHFSDIAVTGDMQMFSNIVFLFTATHYMKRRPLYTHGRPGVQR